MNKSINTKSSVQRLSIHDNDLPNDVIQNELQFHVLEEKRKIVEGIYAIFNKKGAINNDALLEEFDDCIAEVVNSLSEDERSGMDSLTQRGNDIHRRIIERGFVDKDDFTEDFMEKFSADNSIVDPLYNDITEHEFSEYDICSNSWKIDAIFALTNMRKNLLKRIEEIRDFKSGNTSVTYSHLERHPKVLQAIKDGFARTVFTPFGITFLIPNEYAENPNWRGFQIHDSPISIVYIRKNRRGKREISRSTLEHEARHNIFDILELKGQFTSFGDRSLQNAIPRFIKQMENKKMMIKRLRDLHAPEIVIQSQEAACDIRSLNIVDQYIFGLKDEILANFDQLMHGFGSTDINLSRDFLRFLHKIDSIFEQYKDDKGIYSFKDELKKQSEERMEGFYQQISFLFFIARNGTPEIKESIRQLLYLSDMRNLLGVEIALRGIIGNDVYKSLLATYPILTGIHLDETLLGKNPKKTTDFAKRILGGLFTNSTSNDPKEFRYLRKDGKS